MPKFERAALTDFAAQMLQSGGMEADKAKTTAAVLVEGDMIGHETHGLQLLHWYMECLKDGSLNGRGTYDVVSERGAVFVWDGRHLPGAWLLTEALNKAAGLARQYGIAAAAIRNCHHTCALSSYMKNLTDQGLIAQISASNPAAARVAPYGGTKPLLTPNPIATAFPTTADPILIDVSTSITTTTMTQLLAKRGEKYPEAWALTRDGEPTDDPREVTEHGGTMMSLGGALKGHKGYGLALMVDLLGQGLSGKGRANTEPGPLAQSAFIQVIDPAFFAGLEAFTEQSTWTAEAARANPPAASTRGAAVRVPGDSAARHRRDAIAGGVPVADADWVRIMKHADAAGITPPSPV